MSSFFQFAHDFCIIGSNLYDIGGDLVINTCNDPNGTRAIINAREHSPQQLQELRLILLSQEERALLNERLLRGSNPFGSLASHRPCLPDTRRGVLTRIENWIFNGSQRVFWLTGCPGSGKSTIARTIVEHYSRNPFLLICPFFCSRSSDNQGLLHALTYHITQYSRAAARSICDTLRNPANAFICECPSEQHGQTLLLHHLWQMAESMQTTSLLVVVDGLDELMSATNNAVFDVHRALLQSLAVVIEDSPPNTRYLLTSRSDVDVRMAVARLNQNGLIDNYHIRTDDDEAFRDILCYFRTELGAIASRYGLPSDGPVLSLATRLTQQASGLFIWASTAVSYIQNQLRLRGTQSLDSALNVLLTRGTTGIDHLYLGILQRTFDDSSWTDADFLKIRQFFYIVTRTSFDSGAICIQDYQKFLQFGDQLDLVNLLGLLQPILLCDNNTHPNCFSIPRMNPTFQTFIKDSRRCPDPRFCLEYDNLCYDGRLAWCSLMYLQSEFYGLPFFSPKFSRRDYYREPRLLDFSTYFAGYLRHCQASVLPPLHPSIPELMKLLLTEYLLHISRVVIPSTWDTAREWLTEHHPEDCDLLALLAEARSFASLFWEALSMCPKTVAASALALIPPHSRIYALYSSQVNGHSPIMVLQSVLQGWSPYVIQRVPSEPSRYSVMQVSYHYSPFPYSVFPRFRCHGHLTISSDPRNFVFQCPSDSPHPLPNDITRIHGRRHCNQHRSVMQSGQQRLVLDFENPQTNQTHSQLILENEDRHLASVYLSTDARRVVCGFDNGTLSIWETYTCSKVCASPRMHNNPVCSVIFSEDGALIGSASVSELLLWDVTGDTFHLVASLDIPWNHRPCNIKSVERSEGGQVIYEISYIQWSYDPLPLPHQQSIIKTVGSVAITEFGYVRCAGTTVCWLPCPAELVEDFRDGVLFIRGGGEVSIADRLTHDDWRW